MGYELIQSNISTWEVLINLHDNYILSLIRTFLSPVDSTDLMLKLRNPAKDIVLSPK